MQGFYASRTNQPHNSKLLQLPPDSGSHEEYPQSIHILASNLQLWQNAVEYVQNGNGLIVTEITSEASSATLISWHIMVTVSVYQWTM